MEERTLSCPASTPMAQNPDQTVYHSVFMKVFEGNSHTAYEQVILIDNNAFCIHKCNEYLVLKFEQTTWNDKLVVYICTGFRDSRNDSEWRFDDEEDFPNGFEILEDYIEDYVNKA